MVRNLEEERQLKSDGVTEQSTGSENAKKVAERTDKMMSAIFDKPKLTELKTYAQGINTKVAELEDNVVEKIDLLVIKTE